MLDIAMSLGIVQVVLYAVGVPVKPDVTPTTPPDTVVVTPAADLLSTTYPAVTDELVALKVP